MGMCQYITPEVLKDDNRVTCEKCETKRDSKKGIRLTSLPYFLSVHLKRWTFNFATLQRVKLTKKIAFPQTSDASVFVNSDGSALSSETESEANSDAKERGKSTPLEYELYSMMIHTGGAMGGHYFAYIKDFSSGKWLQFNDSNVTEIPSEDIEAWFNRKDIDTDDEKSADVPKERKAAPIPTAANTKVPKTNDNGLDIGAA